MSRVAHAPPLLMLLAAAFGCAHTSSAPPAFVHPLGAEHRLAGRIVETTSGEEISADALLARLADAPRVLIGEKHDNLDHHALEAWLVSRLAERTALGRLSLVMEIFERGESREIEAFLAAHPGDVAHLLRRFGWGRRDDSLAPGYRPVIEAALERRVPILGGDLDGPQRQAIGRGGEVPDALRHAVEKPLPASALEALQSRIRDAHCGHASDAMVGAMVRVQRARDAQLARAVEEAARMGPVLLVAGGEHVRRDVGVPFYLDTPAVSIGLREVPLGEAEDPPTGRFDYLWYTPRVDADDPCEKFRESLERLGTHGKEAP